MVYKPKFGKPGEKEKKTRKRPTNEKRRLALTKSRRKKVFGKYKNRCSYCGAEMEFSNFQIDHLIPLAKFSNKSDGEFWENLMPSCWRCNSYKSANSLEVFRRRLMEIQERIQRDYLVKVAIDFGVVNFTPFDGVFYFEKVKSKKGLENGRKRKRVV
jgi:hypothetical protein